MCEKYSNDNDQIIQKYEKYLNRKKMNKYTIRNYIYDLKAYDKFLNDKHFFEATEQDIRTYIQDKINKKNSENRISFSISTLSSFYKYLVKNYETRNNPVKNLPRPKRRKNKEKECIAIGKIYVIRKELRELDDIQLEVFFGLLCCMAKKYMIPKIEWRKINWKDKYIEIEINEKERCILYLDDYTIDRLVALRKERKENRIKRKWVFISRYNGNWSDISDATISYWMNKIKDIAKVDKLTFSMMKQTTINYWKYKRKYSDEKINKIIEHGKGYNIEFRQDVLKEVQDVLQMK